MAHLHQWTVVHGFSVPKNPRDPGVPDRISLYGVAYRASAGIFTDRRSDLKNFQKKNSEFTS